MKKNGKKKGTTRKRTVSPSSGADVTAHQFAPGHKGPGRPAGTRNWATILREIGDQTPPIEVQEKLRAYGKAATMREAVALSWYLRAISNDAVGNAAAEKIADREDGKATVHVEAEVKNIQGVTIVRAPVSTDA